MAEIYAVPDGRHSARCAAQTVLHPCCPVEMQDGRVQQLVRLFGYFLVVIKYHETLLRRRVDHRTHDLHCYFLPPSGLFSALDLATGHTRRKSTRQVLRGKGLARADRCQPDTGNSMDRTCFRRGREAEGELALRCFLFRRRLRRRWFFLRRCLFPAFFGGDCGSAGIDQLRGFLKRKCFRLDRFWHRRVGRAIGNIGGRSGQPSV